MSFPEREKDGIRSREERGRKPKGGTLPFRSEKYEKKAV